MSTVLRVRMDSLSAGREPLEDGSAAWGGRGLIDTILTREVPPTCHPLGADNKVIFANGPLAGTRTSSAGRLSVGGKSPLTGGIKEANAGGVAGDAMARLGLRAIVVEGKPASNGLFLLVVGFDSAHLVPADDLRGLGTYALVQELFGRYGRKVAVICIGPAGEHRLPLAGVAVNDNDGAPSRYAARGGMGAVMGAKGLKAVVLLDEGQEVPVADAAALREARKRYVAALREHPVTGRAFAEIGTVMSLESIRALGGLPIRNFSQGELDDELPELTGEGIRQTIIDRGGEGRTTHSCMPGCTIRCSNVFPDEAGKTIVSPLEYESLVLLGTNIGLLTVDEAARLNYICNDIGVDTMETGVALGVAMEAGLLDFGDFAAAVALLGEVAKGSTVGRVLGQGASVVGRVFGVERVPACKGQGMSAYDPRAVKSLGVTYATSTMGADHTAGFTFAAKVDHHSPEGQVETSRGSQVVRAALDSLGLCAFVMSALVSKPEIISDLVNAVCGTDHGSGLVSDLGKAVLRIERAFNAAAGFSPADDRIPAFMRKEALPPYGLKFDVSEEEMLHLFDEFETADARSGGLT